MPIGRFFRVSDHCHFHLFSGADINAESMEGETPVMTATMWHYNPMLHMLLREGASIDRQLSSQVATLYCCNVFELALAVHNFHAARLLFYAGAKDTILDHIEEVQILREALECNNGEDTLQALIKELKSQRPRSLKIMSRKVIRDKLGKTIRRNIHEIGLPCLMEEYLLLEDLM